ncbi:MAG: hypothetical protein K2J15_06615 [Muribaculaceae bacterium]|nr:hypothetical protein [Muribaculaceae bacterium]
MQVLTLDSERFDQHCHRLAQMIGNSHPDPFDGIIGIRRGGSVVCDALCLHFNKILPAPRFDISLQRPSTRRKGSRQAALLKRIPYPLLNGLRIIESVILSARRKISPGPDERIVDLPADLSAILLKVPQPEILVVDDAIDSGDTLVAAVNALTRINPDVRVSIAVVTVTTRNPRIRPDYTLYDNRILIRFPWSNDYKQH